MHSEEPADSMPATPSQVVARLFDVLKNGDVKHAIHLTDPIDGPQDMVAAYYEGLSEYAETTETAIVAHVQLHDTALVVFRESSASSTTIDLDPAYLVRRANEWRVLLKLTQYDRPYFKIDDAHKKRFRVLENWFKEQKPKLQTLLQTAGT